MKFIQTALALTALSFAAALPLSAQQPRPSPHDVASAVIGPRGSPRIIIFYGRPYSKDAKTGGDPQDLGRARALRQGRPPGCQ